MLGTECTSLASWWPEWGWWVGGKPHQQLPAFSPAALIFDGSTNPAHPKHIGSIDPNCNVSEVVKGKMSPPCWPTEEPQRPPLTALPEDVPFPRG